LGMKGIRHKLRNKACNNSKRRRSLAKSFLLQFSPALIKLSLTNSGLG
jgi:hypothetical protein